jgi:hypothetical protein
LVVQHWPVFMKRTKPTKMLRRKQSSRMSLAEDAVAVPAADPLLHHTIAVHHAA